MTFTPGSSSSGLSSNATTFSEVFPNRGKEDTTPPCPYPVLFSPQCPSLTSSNPLLSACPSLPEQQLLCDNKHPHSASPALRVWIQGSGTHVYLSILANQDYSSGFNSHLLRACESSQPWAGPDPLNLEFCLYPFSDIVLPLALCGSLPC